MNVGTWWYMHLFPFILSVITIYPQGFIHLVFRCLPSFSYRRLCRSLCYDTQYIYRSLDYLSIMLRYSGLLGLMCNSPVQGQVVTAYRCDTISGLPVIHLLHSLLVAIFTGVNLGGLRTDPNNLAHDLSCPTQTGSLACSQLPVRVWISLPHTPHASSAISTSRSPSDFGLNCRDGKPATLRKFYE